MLSATQVQVLASKAFEDQCNLMDKVRMSRDHISASLQFLSGLGSCGRYSGNCDRELKRWLGTPEYPPAAELPVRVIVQKGRLGLDTIQNVNVPVFLPHVTFSHYFHQHPDKFKNLFPAGLQRSPSNES